MNLYISILIRIFTNIYNDMNNNDRRLELIKSIKNALEEKGMSQKQLAQAMGKSPSEITRWLSGTSNFTIDVLFDMAEILGISYSFETSSILAEGYGSAKYPGHLEDPWAGLITVDLDQSHKGKLERMASIKGISLRAYVKDLLIREAEKPIADIGQFIGCWPDEGLTPEEEASAFRNHRTRNTIVEL